MFLEREKFESRAGEIKGLVWVDMQPVKWTHAQPGHLDKDSVYTKCPDQLKEFDANNQEQLGKDAYVWYHAKVSVPEAKEGYEPAMTFSFEWSGSGKNRGFECLMYINGHPYQGLEGNHKEAVLTPFAGQTVDLTILLWTGMAGGSTARMPYQNILHANIGYQDVKANELSYLLGNIPAAMRWIDDNNPLKADLIAAADRALAVIDWDKEYVRETAHEALCVLKENLVKLPKESPVTVHLAGHTHIDVAWLWRLKHTREKAQRSFATVLRLMDEYPEYKFLQSQPQLYSYLKKDCPEMYAQIKQRVEEGRWEADGGMWLEADCNLTSGESLARQFLYGMRFIEQEFGKRCSYLWLPDVFGYSWALPQIMKLCGLSTFMTTKITWNQYNHMPNDLFVWRGMDGTEILSYFIDVPANPGDIFTNYSTYSGIIDAPTI
jgi:alpha-mannosidase